MTAEIAILNKSAVALAADSAVTIQSGSREEKTYDSADKLFELCHTNAIAIMIYNGLSFAEVPLQILIKKFRDECPQFARVEDAASYFLKYLQKFGAASPQRVKNDAVRRIVSPVLDRMRERFQTRLNQKFLEVTKSSPPTATDLVSTLNATLNDVIATFDRIYQAGEDASFIGDKITESAEKFDEVLLDMISTHFAGADDEQRVSILSIAKLVLRKGILSEGLTGIVIAGFGHKELFPTLVSFEIDGMVGNSLKFMKTNSIDIDRMGQRARVLPFAQKEMVDRFLYGLDDEIERQISTFCAQTAPGIKNAIADLLEYSDEADRTKFEASVQAAEGAFVEGLRTKAFREIRDNSQASIDSLIEFMPKPELAKMAEALVNLTSIKKRVSRGMDTVGGPIDVAVISHAEGFVWVKRKHYFPSDLNPRYFQRVERRVTKREDTTHDEEPSSGSTRKGRATGKSRTRRRNAKRTSAGNR